MMEKRILELEKLTDEDIEEILRTGDIFASAKPKQETKS